MAEIKNVKHALETVKEFSVYPSQKLEAWKKRGFLIIQKFARYFAFIAVVWMSAMGSSGATTSIAPKPVTYDGYACIGITRVLGWNCVLQVSEGQLVSTTAYQSACENVGGTYGFIPWYGDCRVTSAMCTQLGHTGCSSGSTYLGNGIIGLWMGSYTVYTLPCPSGYMFDGSTCTLPANTPNPPKNTSNPDTCAGTNPCNAGTGNKYQHEADYIGTGAYPLKFERMYNSLVTTPAVIESSIFGSQWRGVFDRSIAINTGGGITTATVKRNGGKQYYFNLTGSLWVGDADVVGTLLRLTDATGAVTGWKYTNENDEIENYDATGKLASITSPVGLTHTLTYSDGTASSPNGSYILGATGVPTTTILPLGRLIRVTDSAGHTLQLGYDVLGRVVKATDPAGGAYFYTYSGITTTDHLTSVTYPDGKVRTYLYGEAANVSATPAVGVSYANALTGIIDENVNRYASWTYDAQGRASSSEHAALGSGINHVGLVYGTPDANGNSVTTVTDPRGNVRSYAFSTLLGVVKNTAITGQPCNGCNAALTYDSNGNPATSLDFNGNQTTYVYDLTRNLETSRTEGLTAAGAKTAATRTIITTWHPTYRLPQTITEQDTSTATAVTLRVTTLGYDTSGNLTSRTIADPVANISRSWTYTYDTLGHRLTEDGPRTDVTDLTTYTYDAQGNLATVTNALSQLTTLSNYNAHGQPGTITDANGLVTQLLYDTRQRLTTRTSGYGSATPETTTYNYDGVGQLTSVITPSGATYTYTYDAAHRLTDITDNIGNHIHYTLDVMDSRTQEQIFDAANNVVQSHSRTFDALNRLYQDIGAINQTTTYAYDANGNLTRITDALNRQTNQTYDALNRLITTTDAANGLSRYGYDALDQLVKVTDPNTLITQYQRDGLGNLNVQTSPDTGTTINSYDAAGNLKLHADAKGQQANYSYDELNRVTGITYTGLPAQSITYQYDQGTNGIGHLTTVTDVTGTTSYAYDAHGRLASDTKVTHGASYTTDYSYDAQGRLASMTYPSGRIVSYGFDAMGRTNQISTTLNNVSSILASNISYEPFGGVHSFNFGDGLTTPVQSYVRQRDSDGRIASYTLNGNVMSVGYNTASELISILDPTQPLIPASYDYDALSRLTNYTQGSIGQGYSYDANGNRSTQTLGAATNTYNYAAGSNRLASIQTSSGTTNLTQDANGATTNDTTRQYSYDARGRLIQTTTVAGIINYEVNALGLRTRKQVPYNNADTIYHYDKQGHLIGESPTGTSLVSREYIYLGDQPVAVMQ